MDRSISCALTDDRLVRRFCAACIDFWLQLAQQAGKPRTCPIDRRVLPADELPVIDYEVEAVMNSQVVRCPNAQLGCSRLFSIGEATDHLRTCRYRTVQCASCKKPVTADALARHSERCYRPCEACGVAVPRADVTTHSIWLCLAKAHSPWRTAAEAAAFASSRDAARKGPLAWLTEHSAHVTDWELATTALSNLLGAGGGDDNGHGGVGGDIDDDGSGRLTTRWLQLAEACRQRWWRGARLALTGRAVALEPSSVEALLEHADAQVCCDRAAAALEMYTAAVTLAPGDVCALAGRASCLEALGRWEESLPVWEAVGAAPPDAAPAERHSAARFAVGSARARLALGDLLGGEDSLSRQLGRDDHPEVQAAYADVLERLFLAEVSSEPADASAVPLPPFTPEGRERLFAAHDAWAAVLRAQPCRADATLRLALVEIEMAVSAPVEGEQRALLARATERLEAAAAASFDAPELAMHCAHALVLSELYDEAVSPPSRVDVPRRPGPHGSDEETDEEGDEVGDESTDAYAGGEAASVGGETVERGGERGSGRGGRRCPPPARSFLSSFVGGKRARPRLERAAALLRVVLAVQPSNAAAATLLGVALGATTAAQRPSEATRYLQSGVELLRQRLTAVQAAAQGGEERLARTAEDAAAAGSSESVPDGGRLAAAAAAIFEAVSRADAGGGASGARCSSTVSAGALLEHLLGSGQEPDEVSALFALIEREGDDRVGWDQWKRAFARYTTLGSEGPDEAARPRSRCDGDASAACARSAAGVTKETPAGRSAAGDPATATAVVSSHQLHAASPDLLLLFLASLLCATRRIKASQSSADSHSRPRPARAEQLSSPPRGSYGQCLLLESQWGEALRIMRELCAVAPSLLHSTFRAWK